MEYKGGKKKHYDEEKTTRGMKPGLACIKSKKHRRRVFKKRRKNFWYGVREHNKRRSVNNEPEGNEAPEQEPTA